MDSDEMDNQPALRSEAAGRVYGIAIKLSGF